MKLYKILIVNWQDIKNPLAGGAERNLHEIFSRLTNNYEITAFVSSFPGSKPEDKIDGIKIIRRGKRNNFNFVFYKHYINWLRHKQYDIIIEDLNKIPFFTPLFSSTPKIAILHHFFGPVIYKETNPLFASYVYITERLVGKFYRGVEFVAVSESTKQDLIAYGVDKERISVIYNGVDTEFYRPVEKKSEQPLIISIGRLKKYKAIDHLVLAMQKVIKEIPDARLMIVGGGDDKSRLERLTERLRLNKNIFFTGFISETEKRKLSSAAWFGVSTSEKEGFGLVNVEIQACGTPVISASSPGLRESVEHAKSGLLYRYGDIDDLSNKMIILIKDQGLRSFLSGNASRFAHKFSWANAARQMEIIINQTLSRSRK